MASTTIWFVNAGSSSIGLVEMRWGGVDGNPSVTEGTLIGGQYNIAPGETREFPCEWVWYSLRGSRPNGYRIAECAAYKVYGHSTVIFDGNKTTVSAGPPAATQVHAGGVFAFRSVDNGKLLVAEAEATLKVNRKEIGAWEKFKLIPQVGTVKEYYHVALKTAHGKYVVAETDQPEILANRDAIGPWEVFQIYTIPDGNVAFKTAHGKWVQVQGEKLVASQSVPADGNWAGMRFQVIKIS